MQLQVNWSNQAGEYVHSKHSIFLMDVCDSVFASNVHCGICAWKVDGCYQFYLLRSATGMSQRPATILEKAGLRHPTGLKCAIVYWHLDV